MLACALWEETRSKGGGDQVRLSNVDTGNSAGFKDKLICCFILVVDKIVASESL